MPGGPSAWPAGRGGSDAGPGDSGKRSLIPFVLIPLALLVYLLTFSHVSSLDALYYYRDFERGALRDLLHPHHPIYELVARGWCDLWRVLGWPGPAEVPAKSLSLVAAAGALAVFARTLRLLFGGGFMAGALLLVMAFSYLPWHVATEAEPVIFFILFSCLNLDLLLRRLLLPRGSGPAAWKLGLANVLGVLFHQELILVVPFSLVVLWLRPGTRDRRRLVPAHALLVAAGIGIPYALAAHLATGARDPAGWVRWVTHYGHFFAGSYGQITGQTPANTLRGLSALFLGGTALKAYAAPGVPRDPRLLAALLPFLGLAAILVLGLGALLVSLRSGRARRAGGEGGAPAAGPDRTWAPAGALAANSDRTWAPAGAPVTGSLIPIRLLAAWLIVSAGFAIWWMPENRNFWAPTLPALVILCGIGLASLDGNRAARVARQVVPAAWILLLVAGNLSGGILHKHFMDDARQELSVRLLRTVGPGDLVVLPADRLWLCATYYHPEIRCIGLDPPRPEPPAVPGRELQGAGPIAGDDAPRPTAGSAVADSSWVAAAHAAAQTLLNGHRVLVEWTLLPGFAALTAAGLPGDGRIETWELLEFADSEQPSDRRRMMEMRGSGAER